MTLIRKALVFATEAHDGQDQDEGGPYILHPVRVMERVLKAGYGAEYAAVALLHDTIEDTDVTEGWIRGVFGDEIADAVVALTHKEGESRADYLVRCMGNPIAHVVKIADVQDNRNRPPVADPDRQERLNAKYAQALRILT